MLLSDICVNYHMGGSDGYPGLQVWFIPLIGGAIGGPIAGAIVVSGGGILGLTPVRTPSKEFGPPSGAMTGLGPLMYGVLYGFLPTQKSRQPPIFKFFYL